MKPLYQTLTPRPSVFSKSYTENVLDLTDLEKQDPAEFFKLNYITRGMKQLYKAVMGRLDGSIPDGVFKLTQAMGGGKTHNMFAIGLLAKHPEFRQPVMGKVYNTPFTGACQVISFVGREKPKNGIWGHIAASIGKADTFKHLYDENDAPGQSDWIKLLGGEHVVILIDELPVYFNYAKTVQFGAGTLAQKTTRALETLLNAMGKAELKNCVLVISDLQGSYQSGSEDIESLLSDFEKETQRVAKNFTPVQQNSNEIYSILRKRLFKEDPAEDDVQDVAAAYRDALERTTRMNLTTESPTQLEASIRESYPFHPSMRDLYARFKENPGFMQTRGLIRLVRCIVADMWQGEAVTARESYLIHPYDVNPNDPDTNTELSGINNKLVNAISNDIASQGRAAAERIDQDLGSHLASKAAKLLFMSSLSNVQGGVRGLKTGELFAYLSSPGADIGGLEQQIIPRLREESWYLHGDKAGNLLYKDIKNVSAQISNYRKGLPSESIEKAIREKLTDLFKPLVGDVYQEVKVLASVDDIQPDKSKITLIIYQPHTGGSLHPDLQALYDNTRYKNQLLFLTGDQVSMDRIREIARSIRATESVEAEMQQDRVPNNDPQFQQLQELKLQYESRFFSALQSVFTKFYYPTKRGLMDGNINLHFKANQYDGEEQLRNALFEKRKFLSTTNDAGFLAQVEQKLFTGQQSRPWAQVVEAAATDTSFPWTRPNALQELKQEQIRRDHWRENGNWVEIGPFAKPDTTVRIEALPSAPGADGKFRLNITPVRGDKVLYSYDDKVTENSPELKDLGKLFETDELTVSFLCIDSSQQHSTGDRAIHHNQITLKYEHYPQGQEWIVELEAYPKNVEIKYTTDGSDPEAHGGRYQAPFPAPPETLVQAIAVKGQHRSNLISFRTPKAGDTGFQIDAEKPLRYGRRLKIETTAECYQKLNLLNIAQAKLEDMQISTQQGQDYAVLNTSANLTYTAGKVENMIKFLQDDLLEQGNISLHINRLHFPTGEHFQHFAQDAQLEYKPSDLEQ